MFPFKKTFPRTFHYAYYYNLASKGLWIAVMMANRMEKDVKIIMFKYKIFENKFYPELPKLIRAK